MRWEDIEKEFDFEISFDEPVFPMNIVCEMIQMQYHVLHEIMKEGILREKKRKKHKKLFSPMEVKRLKYIQYLMQDRGVNLNGIKVILEIKSEE